ncbi:uncharacterized protein LOC115626474 [Scaptodrosophila lebanonensis]|uniref:Uncharacterized protein LOC115626474 n=1 Tax=Drosophila lebanonensis TaxID=7225 RepID=A0A6J2TRZ5_DROLE|nr:uncharacterized protein LOC115626474 [Scaptodrosophila lebanonensis]
MGKPKKTNEQKRKKQQGQRSYGSPSKAKHGLQNNTAAPAHMPEARSAFKKFKDNQMKKSPKRLQNKNKHGGKKNLQNRTYMQKLLSSIKRRTGLTPQRSCKTHIKRKLDFQAQGKKQKETVNELPKPKFYPSKEYCEKVNRLEDTIEDGEILEDQQASNLSDDDDCVIIHTPSLEKIVLEDTDDDDEVQHEKPMTSNQARGVVDNLLYQDRKRSNDMLFKPKGIKGLLYNTISSNCVNSPNSLKTNNSKCIVIDDNCDNSVIFVGECTAADFIALPPDDPKPPRRKIDVSKKLKNSLKSDDIYTTVEKRQLNAYNSNTYNPSAAEDKPASGKRPILIDGSNVAFAHGCSNVYSTEGIKYCIEYFEKMGHDVKAVVPMFRRNPEKSSNPELLDKLHKAKKVVFTPCKNIPGQKSASYDDRFILQLAYEINAAVVSNDNYRDLINESPAFKKIIENRVIGYTFCNDIFILPKDPYGRWGPTLDQILKY